jgi:hypothetical protein
MPITDSEALQRAIEHREIFPEEMLHLMRRIMTGEMTPVMAAAFIAALRVKKETVGEIAAAAQVMRELSRKVELPPLPHLVDVVGTGGDGSHSFNISTLLGLRGRRRRRPGGQAWRAQCVEQDRQRRRAGGARRAHRPGARGGGTLHPRGWDRLHVRAQPPPGHEEHRPGAQGNSACARSSTSSVR